MRYKQYKLQDFSTCLSRSFIRRKGQMEELGLTRVPYYSELSVFNRDDVQNDAVCLVLSVMLYWHSLEKCQRFNARNHVHLLARNLRRTPECVKECLDYLTSLKILDKKKKLSPQKVTILIKRPN